MNNLNKIVNIEKHPIINKEYIKKCNKLIQENSILILKNFINKDCLKELIDESLKLEKQAFYCSQNHTILLNKKNKFEDPSDPLNIEVVSDKGCVPHDLISNNSKLNLLYKSSLFKKSMYGI